LLFLCFVAPLATTFLVLQYQKKQVRKAVKWKMITGIDKEELVLLKFTEKEKQSLLNWKHDREFEYKGEMYDIVEIELKNDTTYYWCWWDHEETRLNKQLSELIWFKVTDNPKNKENQKRLSIFFKSLYFAEYIEKKPFSPLGMKTGFYSHSKLYQILFYPPPVPPPIAC